MRKGEANELIKSPEKRRSGATIADNDRSPRGWMISGGSDQSTEDKKEPLYPQQENRKELEQSNMESELITLHHESNHTEQDGRGSQIHVSADQVKEERVAENLKSRFQRNNRYFHRQNGQKIEAKPDGSFAVSLFTGKFRILDFEEDS